MLERDAALDTLRDMLPDLSAEYGVTSLAVFGSVARGDADESSDLDLLVEFKAPIGLFEFARLKQRLEETFDCSVDLVEPDALAPAARERILAEARHAA